MENGEATLRQQIIALLRVRPWEAGGLSHALGISQRQVESHLTHVRKSVEAHGERMVIVPAQCRDCGFEFAERTRTTKPSRCPKCKSEQLAPPVFEIQGRRSAASV
jgi:transcriptional regulator